MLTPAVHSIAIVTKSTDKVALLKYEADILVFEIGTYQARVI